MRSGERRHTERHYEEGDEDDVFHRPKMLDDFEPKMSDILVFAVAETEDAVTDTFALPCPEPVGRSVIVEPDCEELPFMNHDKVGAPVSVGKENGAAYKDSSGVVMEKAPESARPKRIPRSGSFS